MTGMKTDMEKLVGRIPTHQETVDKCLEKFMNLVSCTNWAKSSYEGGHGMATKCFLEEAGITIEEIRKLVGGSNG